MNINKLFSINFSSNKDIKNKHMTSGIRTYSEKDVYIPDSNKSLVSENRLFPNGIKNIEFEQEKESDCALLAVLYALSRDKNGQKFLENMIKVNESGNYMVQFSNGKNIEVEKRELSKITTKADTGINVIEVAYGKLKKNICHYRGDFRYALRQGEFPYRAINYITGWQKRMNLMNDESKHTFKSCLEKLGQHCGKYVVIAQTPYSIRAKKNKFLTNHAYALSNVDIDTKTVTVIDPHDTKKKIPVGFDEFEKIFEAIYITKSEGYENYS